MSVSRCHAATAPPGAPPDYISRVSATTTTTIRIPRSVLDLKMFTFFKGKPLDKLLFEREKCFHQDG